MWRVRHSGPALFIDYSLQIEIGFTACALIQINSAQILCALARRLGTNLDARSAPTGTCAQLRFGQLCSALQQELPPPTSLTTIARRRRRSSSAIPSAIRWPMKFCARCAHASSPGWRAPISISNSSMRTALSRSAPHSAGCCSSAGYAATARVSGGGRRKGAGVSKFDLCQEFQINFLRSRTKHSDESCCRTTYSTSGLKCGTNILREVALGKGQRVRTYYWLRHTDRASV